MSLKVELPEDDTLPEKKNLSVNVSHSNHDQEKGISRAISPD